MTHHEELSSKEKRIDSIKEFKDANARRVEQLIDVVEKHTRTERHLEQNLGVSSLDDVRHALKVQEEREREIENLKNIIAYGRHDQDDLRNLNRNYTFASNYLDHYAARMDEDTLEKTKEKQENRKTQLDSLEKNSRMW